MPKLGRRSETTEVDHMLAKGLLTRNAPFGTNDTPNFKVKIIGGKPVTVYEGNAGAEKGKEKPPLQPVTEKPTQLDPWELKDKVQVDDKWGYSSAHKDVYNSHIHNKQINPFKALPPISRSPTAHAHVSEYTQTPVEEGTQTDNTLQERNIYNYLPKDRYVTDKPISLSKREEVKLLHELHDGLGRFDPKKLRDIYLELAGYDNGLTGWIDYKDLSFTMSKFQVLIQPHTLRLAASLFVSPDHPGMVNYEKFLSYLGAASKEVDTQSMSVQRREEQKRRQWEHVQRGGYKEDHGYGHHMDSPRGNAAPSPFTEQKVQYFKYPSPRDASPSQQTTQKFYDENGKLLRLVEQQLLDHEDDLDFEQMRAMFTRADRERRGTLSREQIKEICYRSRLPLQESILNQVIDRSQGASGQYHWEKFIEFLERVQPLSTGLKIPPSKRPTEYVKHFPEPTENWPKGDTPRETPVPAHLSPRDYDRSPRVPPTHYNEPNNPNEHLPLRHPRTEKLDEISQKMDKQKDIEKIEQELRQLEDNYQYTRRRLEEQKEQESEPWFQRFLKLADGLYKNDLDLNGYLSLEEVTRLCMNYNNIYNLKIPEKVIDDTIHACSNGEQVAIDPLLKMLGKMEY